MIFNRKDQSGRLGNYIRSQRANSPLMPAGLKREYKRKAAEATENEIMMMNGEQVEIDMAFLKNVHINNEHDHVRAARAMANTFEARRAWIRDAHPSIDQICHRFPILLKLPSLVIYTFFYNYLFFQTN
jgi:hypothetical protein